MRFKIVDKKKKIALGGDISSPYFSGLINPWTNNAYNVQSPLNPNAATQNPIQNIQTQEIPDSDTGEVRAFNTNYLDIPSTIPTLQTSNPTYPLTYDGPLGDLNAERTFDARTTDQIEADFESQQPNNNTNLNGNVNLFGQYNIGGGALDTNSYATQLGVQIGRAQDSNLNGGARAFSAFGAVASGLGLGFGVARQTLGALSSYRMNSQLERAAQERLAREREGQYVSLQKGGVYVGNGEWVNTKDFTGEYVYPLPKSMENKANVEVEKGEYILPPDGSAPMEAKGEKHENGGTPLSVDDSTLVVSDHTNITDGLAKLAREEYGLKVTPKNTYADVLDKYKDKIGLKSKYEEQENLLKKLEDNKKIKDQNTVRANQTILSKRINEVQQEIDGLEDNMTRFSNIVFASQEERKTKEEEGYYFRKGGIVDSPEFQKLKKDRGWSDDEARRKVLEIIKQNKDILQAQEGLTFSIVNNPYDTRSLYAVQSANNTAYGEAGNNPGQRLYELSRQFPALTMGDNPILTVDQEAGTASYTNPELENAALIQNQIQNTYQALRSIAPNIRNNEELNNYIDQIQFLDSSVAAVTGARDLDNKFGEFTSSRPSVGLSVLTQEQKNQLNEAGINNYVQLVANPDTARNILGDERFNQLIELQNTDGAAGLDFRLDAYDVPDLLQTPGIPQLPTNPTAPDISSIGAPAQQLPQVDPQTGEPVTATDATTRNGINAGANSLLFPEVYRRFPSPIQLEGLERYQYLDREPILRSSDQYYAELSRNTNAALNSLGEVPDSQRAAILSNITAVAAQEAGKVGSEVDYYNAAERERARQYTENAFMTTNEKNIAARREYEAGYLQASAIREENINRLIDNINEESQAKFNTYVTYNALQSAFPNARLLPNGQIVYDNQGQPIVSPINSANALEAMYQNNNNKGR